MIVLIKSFYENFQPSRDRQIGGKQIGINRTHRNTDGETDRKPEGEKANN